MHFLAHLFQGVLQRTQKALVVSSSFALTRAQESELLDTRDSPQKLQRRVEQAFLQRVDSGRSRW